MISVDSASCECFESEESLLFEAGVNSLPFFVEDSEKSDGPMLMKFDRAVKLSDIMVLMAAVVLGSSMAMSLSRH